MARILLVDDDADSSEALRLYLELEGHVIEVVATAEEALGRLEAANPELVISDLRLPGMSGEELAGRIAGREKRPRLIALSGEHPVRTGFDRYLEKPCRPPDLLRAVDEVLRSESSR